VTISDVVVEALRWYVVLGALAWLMYPIVFFALRGLPDRGLSLVRPLGLLFAALIPWWLSALSPIPYTNTLIIGIPSLLGIIAWYCALHFGDLARHVRTQRRRLVIYELMTALLFVGYVTFRSFNPNIQHTEKPMELAFLTTIQHAHSLPPADPWFLGHSINYYYLGYLLMALPARISRIAPSHAFNLALATLFATATVAAVGTAINFVRSWSDSSTGREALTGFLAGLFLVGIGNLYTPLKFVEHPLRTLQGAWWQGVSWNASRIITDGPNFHTINEFPAFSFVLGDLHPHVLAYPMFISSIAVGLSLSRAGRRLECLVVPAALGGILSASLFATNSWDMPPALLFSTVGILIATIGWTWRQRLVPFVILMGSALVTVLPFQLNYTAAVGLQASEVPASIRAIPIVNRLVRTIGFVLWPRSSTAELFTVHGLFLAISLLFLLPLALPVLKHSKRSNRLVVAAVAILFYVSLLLQFPALFWFVGPMIVIFIMVVSGSFDPIRRYLISLFGVAFLLLSITELIFLEDAFSDRMNTVFKLYFQVWAIFAIGCAVALPVAIRNVRQQRSKIAASLITVPIAVVILGAALYPPISAYRWTSGFSHFSGTDGLAYLDATAPSELAAIDWLDAHASSTDHLLEAPGCSYGEAETLPTNTLAGAYGVAGTMPDNIFSMATGLSTPLGWQFHEYQWRLGDPAISTELAERKADVATIYNNPTSSQARSLLEKYDIRYIVDGPIEQNGYGTQCDGGAPYSAQGLAQLGSIGWPLVFQSGDVKIYQRP
jgi:YYY domain-containing protein